MFKDRFERAIRKEMLALIADSGTEKDAWARFRAQVDTVGIDNYMDAPDVEAFSIGYTDGLKAKQRR